MLDCPSDDEIADVLVDIDVTTTDSQSMLIPNDIALSRDEDPTDEPKLKPSEAYALVLGHRRLVLHELCENPSEGASVSRRALSD